MQLCRVEMSLVFFNAREYLCVHLLVQRRSPVLKRASGENLWKIYSSSQAGAHSDLYVERLCLFLSSPHWMLPAKCEINNRRQEKCLVVHLRWDTLCIYDTTAAAAARIF